VTLLHGTALVRAPSGRLAEGIVTHVARSAVDVALARVQHAAYAAALAAAGWLIGQVPAAEDCPDSVFVGCHVVPLGGDRVLIAASAPRTAGLIEDLGFTPVVADITEFEKLEGCVTCLSVLLPAREG
jgi:dimethylargininase